MSKLRMVAALLVAGVFSLPAPAYANHGEPIYNTIYYSDATYTVEVGWDYGDCCYFGACYPTHTGQSSNYIQYQLVGYCGQDEHGHYYWEPL